MHILYNFLDYQHLQFSKEVIEKHVAKSLKFVQMILENCHSSLIHKDMNFHHFESTRYRSTYGESDVNTKRPANGSDQSYRIEPQKLCKIHVEFWRSKLVCKFSMVNVIVGFKSSFDSNELKRGTVPLVEQIIEFEFMPYLQQE